MRNCKKCGAIMRDDFVFCGVCGEPVEKNVFGEKFVKTKKINSIRRLERRLTKSTGLNILFSSVWLVISVICVFLFLGTFRGIRASFAGISYAYSQMILKYEYIREGLSYSYISSEFTMLVNFIMSWVLLIFFAITVILGIVMAVTHIIRITEIKKRNIKRATDTLGRIAARAEIISAAITVVLFILSLILKGAV